MTIVDGRLHIEPLVEEFPAASIILGEQITEFQLQTAFRFNDVQNALNPFVELVVLEDVLVNTTADWAGIGPNGHIVFGSAGTRQGETSFASHDELVDSDVHMRMRVEGEQFSLSVWLDGHDAPSQPQVIGNRTGTANRQFSLALNASNALDSSISVQYFAVLPLVNGDYNANGAIDGNDIDLMTAEFSSPDPNGIFDLDGDGRLTEADRTAFVTQVIGTYFGDSNLDGEFNSADFVAVFRAAEYEDEIPKNSTWTTGDWNGDGDFDSSDFISAFEHAGYERGPRAALAGVPEPPGALCLLVVLVLAVGTLRRRSATR